MKYSKNLSKFIISPRRILNEEQLREKEFCEQSFYNFVQIAWEKADGEVFKNGFHVEALCEHLDALYNLEIRNLIVNMPPRMGKSMMISVLFNAYIWIKEPKFRFIYSSHNETTTNKDSILCRRLIMSEWFQSLWGDNFYLMKDVNNVHRFDTNHNGFRLSFSIRSGITGSGADLIVADDPNSITGLETDTERRHVIRWWDSTMPSRYRSIKSIRRIVTQQRNAHNDLSGYILSYNNPSWVHFYLPMEFEEKRRCITVPLVNYTGDVPWQDIRTKEGELICPAIFDDEGLVRLKDEMKNESFRIAGQLQQRVAPSGGGIIKRDWFKKWTSADPTFDYIISSWDTALTATDTSCYSVCTTWGIFRDHNNIRNIMFLSIFKDKVEYPPLRKMAKRLAQNYNDTDLHNPIKGANKPHMILIEQAVSGYCLLQDLIAADLPVFKFSPSKYGDKIKRVRIVSHLIENGQVWVKAIPPEREHLTQDAQVLLDAIEFFPMGDGTDVVDTMSQAFIRILEGGLVSSSDDKEYVSKKAIKNKPYY